jgi:hypothetical protein
LQLDQVTGIRKEKKTSLVQHDASDVSKIVEHAGEGGSAHPTGAVDSASTGSHHSAPPSAAAPLGGHPVPALQPQASMPVQPTQQHPVPSLQSQASLPVQPTQQYQLPTQQQQAQHSVPLVQQQATLPAQPTQQHPVPSLQQQATLPSQPTQQHPVPSLQQQATLPSQPTQQHPVSSLQQQATLLLHSPLNNILYRHCNSRLHYHRNLLNNILYRHCNSRQLYQHRPLNNILYRRLQQQATLPLQSTQQHSVPLPQQQATLPAQPTHQHAAPSLQQQASLPVQVAGGPVAQPQAGNYDNQQQVRHPSASSQAGYLPNTPFVNLVQPATSHVGTPAGSQQSQSTAAVSTIPLQQSIQKSSVASVSQSAAVSASKQAAGLPGVGAGAPIEAWTAVQQHGVSGQHQGTPSGGVGQLGNNSSLYQYSSVSVGAPYSASLPTASVLPYTNVDWSQSSVSGSSAVQFQTIPTLATQQPQAHRQNVSQTVLTSTQQYGAITSLAQHPGVSLPNGALPHLAQQQQPVSGGGVQYVMMSGQPSAYMSQPSAAASGASMGSQVPGASVQQPYAQAMQQPYQPSPVHTQQQQHVAPNAGNAHLVQQQHVASQLPPAHPYNVQQQQQPLAASQQQVHSQQQQGMPVHGVQQSQQVPHVDSQQLQQALLNQQQQQQQAQLAGQQYNQQLQGTYHQNLQQIPQQVIGQQIGQPYVGGQLVQQPAQVPQQMPQASGQYLPQQGQHVSSHGQQLPQVIGQQVPQVPQMIGQQVPQVLGQQTQQVPQQGQQVMGQQVPQVLGQQTQQVPQQGQQVVGQQVPQQQQQMIDNRQVQQLQQGLQYTQLPPAQQHVQHQQSVPGVQQVPPQQYVNTGQPRPQGQGQPQPVPQTSVVQQQQQAAAVASQQAVDHGVPQQTGVAGVSVAVSGVQQQQLKPGTLQQQGNTTSAPAAAAAGHPVVTGTAPSHAGVNVTLSSIGGHATETSRHGPELPSSLAKLQHDLLETLHPRKLPSHLEPAVGSASMLSVPDTSDMEHARKISCPQVPTGEQQTAEHLRKISCPVVLDSNQVTNVASQELAAHQQQQLSQSVPDAQIGAHHAQPTQAYTAELQHGHQQQQVDKVMGEERVRKISRQESPALQSTICAESEAAALSPQVVSDGCDGTDANNTVAAAAAKAKPKKGRFQVSELHS